jgi:adenosine deaminase
MKDFVPGKESGHDHFFNGFLKYIPIVIDYRPELLAEIIQRAAQQEEQYLEIMAMPDNAKSTGFGELIKDIPSYKKKKQLLLANKDFQNNINNTVTETDRILNQARHTLGCQSNPQAESCKINIKFLYYSLREQTEDKFFAQVLNAFEAVSRSKGNLVGVNLVQPEDGIISLRDYHKQMLIFDYLHQIYPKVNISLHAGELEPGAVVPAELGYHINDALFTGHAQRIGHGVDIAYENNAESTLEYMAKNHLPVEVNLISNLKILNISGRNHPLNYYLSHHVPVVLSTDDEGVLRTDLTSQYVEAVISHGLDYQALKQINRNALTYAFLPGKSLWIDANKAEPVLECLDLKSKACNKFIKNNTKANIQWQLEQKIIYFENKYNSNDLLH